MSYIHELAYDAALSFIRTNAQELWCLSGATDPVDYAAALAAKCGTKVGPTISVPEDTEDDDGRRIIISAINDGVVNVSAVATRWALVDVTNTRVICVRKFRTPDGEEDGSKQLIVGSLFVLGTIEIAMYFAEDDSV